MASFIGTFFQANDANVAALGALMQTRTLATSKLYYYNVTWVGDSDQPLRNGATATVNGSGVPISITLTHDTDGNVTSYTATDPFGAALPAGPGPLFKAWKVDPQAGTVYQEDIFGVKYAAMGNLELRPQEGGALTSTQAEIAEITNVIASFSNLISGTRQALKSVLNVIR